MATSLEKNITDISFLVSIHLPGSCSKFETKRKCMEDLVAKQNVPETWARKNEIRHIHQKTKKIDFFQKSKEVDFSQWPENIDQAKV